MVVVVVVTVTVVVVEFLPHSQKPVGHPNFSNALQKMPLFCLLMHGPLPNVHPLQLIAVVVAVGVVVVVAVVVVVVVAVVVVVVVTVVTVVVVEFLPHSQKPVGHPNFSNALQKMPLFCLLMHGPLPNVHPLQLIAVVVAVGVVVVVAVVVVVVVAATTATRTVV